MARKIEVGEKITEGKRMIQVGGEFFEVDPEAADAYEKLLTSPKKATPLTRGGVVVLTVFALVFLGPLAIWLYKIALGL